MPFEFLFAFDTAEVVCFAFMFDLVSGGLFVQTHAADRISGHYVTNSLSGLLFSKMWVGMGNWATTLKLLVMRNIASFRVFLRHVIERLLRVDSWCFHASTHPPKNSSESIS